MRDHDGITPIRELRTGTENRIFIKRDDLLPFCMGGNKVRIAKAFIEDMKNTGCNAMLMYGDLRSNLCRVLGNMCLIEDIPCAMVATSEHSDGEQTINSLMTGMFGVHVINADKSNVASGVEEGLMYFEEKGLKPYYIYGDKYGKGNEGSGALAYRNAFEELISWEIANGIVFDRIYTPVGTGCTYAGLVIGNVINGSKSRIVGISISSRSKERCLEAFNDALTGYADKYGDLPENIPGGDLGRIEVCYNRGGYGVHDEVLDKEIDDLMCRTGIAFDPVYSGKAFSGMMKDLEDTGAKGENILFLHTGGTTLYLDYLINKKR